MEIGKAPVLLIDEIDRVSLMIYLEKYNIISQSIVNIQNRKVSMNNQTFNQIALIQQSVGKNKDVGYMQVPCNLDPENKINYYSLLFSINNSKFPDEKLLLVSAFPNRVKDVENQLKDEKFEQIEDIGNFQLLEVRKEN